MIVFEGIRFDKTVGFIKFTNSENKSSVEIPLSTDVAKHISLHLSRVSPAIGKVVEHGNDEDSD